MLTFLRCIRHVKKNNVHMHVIHPFTLKSDCSPILSRVWTTTQKNTNKNVQKNKIPSLYRVRYIKSVNSLGTKRPLTSSHTHPHTHAIDCQDHTCHQAERTKTETSQSTIWHQVQLWTPISTLKGSVLKHQLRICFHTYTITVRCGWKECSQPTTTQRIFSKVPWCWNALNNNCLYQSCNIPLDWILVKSHVVV